VASNEKIKIILSFVISTSSEKSPTIKQFTEYVTIFVFNEILPNGNKKRA
jgi:hypothetical protein